MHARFDDYLRAYDEVIEQTSTAHAPWYVVPADRNWVRNLAVARILLEALRKLRALKRVAFAVDAKGEPALDAAAFWTAFDETGGR